MTDIEEFSKRRREENERIFRQINQGMKRTTTTLFEDKEDAEVPLNFYCECSLMSCRDRVRLPVALYDQIHKDPNQFVILPSHEDPEIERITEQHADYFVVKKLAA